MPEGIPAGALEGVRVCVRVRPPSEKELLQRGGLAITTPNDGTSVVIEGKDHTVKCQFDKVFSDTCTQADVFEQVKPAIAQVAQGYSACILAYGQTGSGKTHTMLGPDGGRIALAASDGEGTWGVIPKAVAYLHKTLTSLASHSGATFSLHCSYMQIYNEKLHDLLQEQGFRDNLEIHEMAKGRNKGEIYVSGLAEFRVKDVEDVLELIQQGSRNRAIRATECNEVSSRSHAILQLLVEVESSGPNGQRTVRRAKLSLVDLAGSEKINKMNDMTQHHLKELTSINRSLSALGNVIAALSEKRRTHIPYRDSKLTRLMQDSLGGNCRTVVIACLAPGRCYAEESISTTQFADRARNVLVRVKANEVVDDKVLLARAQTEIVRLKLLLKKKGGAADEEKDKEIAALAAENAALRAEVKRLKMEMNVRDKAQRSGGPGGGGGSGSGSGNTTNMSGVFRKIFARGITQPPTPHDQQDEAVVSQSEIAPLEERMSSETREECDERQEEETDRHQRHDDHQQAAEEDQEYEEEEGEEEVEEEHGDRRQGKKKWHNTMRQRAPWSDVPNNLPPQRASRLTPITPPAAAAGEVQPHQQQRGKRRARSKYLGGIGDGGEAEYEVTATLRKEERHLLQIREQRKKLEQQLAMLQAKKAATGVSPSKANDGGGGGSHGWSDLHHQAPSPGEYVAGSKPRAGARRKRATSLSGLTTGGGGSNHSHTGGGASSSSAARPSTSEMQRRQKSSSDQQQRAARKTENITLAYGNTTKPPTYGNQAAAAAPSPQRNGPRAPAHHHHQSFHEPVVVARVQNSIADLGLRLKIYSFRYDDWSECSVIGYDRIRKMHYCRYDATNEKHWHTLGTKKVEVVGYGGGGSAGDDDGDYGDDDEAGEGQDMAGGGQGRHVPYQYHHGGGRGVVGDAGGVGMGHAAAAADGSQAMTGGRAAAGPAKLHPLHPAHYDDGDYDYDDDEWGGGAAAAADHHGPRGGTAEAAPPTGQRRAPPPPPSSSTSISGSSTGSSTGSGSSSTGSQHIHMTKIVSPAASEASSTNSNRSMDSVGGRSSSRR